MKKLIAITCFMVAFHGITHAQVDTREFIFSAAPELSIPMGNFKKTSKAGFGGNFIGQVSLAEKFRLLINFGGVLYNGKTYEIDPGISDNYPTTTILRLRGGIKYFLTEGFFVAGNIGAASVGQSGTSKIGFSYAPQIGYELWAVDIFAKYDVVSTNGSNIGALGICIGYRF
jgi:hypothetical protein